MAKKDKDILHKHYIELVKLQNEIIQSKLKFLIILEGRDTAGKDSAIKALTKHLSPRETRIVALSKPTEKEFTEWYFQRFTVHLPAAGELVFFNRSWYNRLGVEKVMKYCTNEQYKSFFNEVALFEKILTDSGVILLKYYLDINKEEQAKRLKERKTNPLKKWKISPIDEVAQKYWNEYSSARNTMLKRTNFKYAPWFVVDANSKSKAQLAIMSHLLEHVNYKNKDKKLQTHHLGILKPANTKEKKKSTK